MAKTSVQIFYAPIFMNESRLLKTCNSLLRLSLVSDIHIIGYWINGLLEEENINNDIKIHRIKTLIKSRTFEKGLFRKFIAIYSFLEYHIGTIRKCKVISPDYISCHNVQLLPLCAFIKFITGAKLFYEPHELESEKTGISGLSKSIIKIIEKVFIRFSDKIVTVCEPITNDYIERYRIEDSKIYTICNVPVNPSIGKSYIRSGILREKFNIPQESIIYIYQGLVDRYRGIQNYLDTFSKVNLKNHLVIMGYGDDVEIVKDFASRFPNIHYQEAVPVSEIINYTSSADIGLFIIPGDVSLSYRYALPNKFYEYAIAGLYICVSDNFEYLKKIVVDDDLGTVIGSKDKDLLEWIESMPFNSPDSIDTTEENSFKRSNYGWQNEEKVFCQLYE
jgi:glycosyltransferase involved in cell wall biosynthesis